MSAIWGKVYGSLHSSVKWQRATKGARACWTSAFSWSIAQGTDGYIPSDVLRVLDATKAEAHKLVEVGLWEEIEGGWTFHDWLGHNLSDQHIQEEREKTRQRVQKHRTRERNSVTPPTSNGVTGDSGNPLRVTGSNAARTEQNRIEESPLVSPVDVGSGKSGLEVSSDPGWSLVSPDEEVASDEHEPVSW